jgi:hypothetical protein
MKNNCEKTFSLYWSFFQIGLYRVLAFLNGAYRSQTLMITSNKCGEGSGADSVPTPPTLLIFTVLYCTVLWKLKNR